MSWLRAPSCVGALALEFVLPLCAWPFWFQAQNGPLESWTKKRPREDRKERKTNIFWFCKGRKGSSPFGPRSRTRTRSVPSWFMRFFFFCERGVRAVWKAFGLNRAAPVLVQQAAVFHFLLFVFCRRVVFVFSFWEERADVVVTATAHFSFCLVSLLCFTCRCLFGDFLHNPVAAVYRFEADYEARPAFLTYNMCNCF